MTSQTPSNVNQSPFLPTAIFLPQEQEQMLIRLNTFLNQVCLFMNQREIANYDLKTEIQTGQRWFNTSTNPVNNPKRSGFRKVFTFGAIPAGANIMIPHGIPNFTLLTNVYGNATIGAGIWIVLPHVDQTLVTKQVGIVIDGTNITIGNGADATAIVSGVITLEYLRN